MPAKPEKTIAHTALVLWVPITSIWPDAVMVASPVACTRSALWLGPLVIVWLISASFAVRVAGALIGLANVVLARFTALTTVPSAMTWTPGRSVTLMGVLLVLTLMPVGYWAGGLTPGAQVVASGVPVHCA